MYLGLLTVFHPEPKEHIYLDIQLISSRDGRKWERVCDGGEGAGPLRSRDGGTPARVGDGGEAAERLPGRDGRKWERVGDRAPIIPVGRQNLDGDFGFNSPSSGPPVRVGDELWFYYSGRSYRHPVTGQGREPNKGAIGLAKLRLDGFVSMDSGREEGALTTRELRPAHTSLWINAEASRGEVRVELLDESGRPLAGYSREECMPLRGDGVRQQVAWKNNRSLPSGRAVRLKFYVRDASLYSFTIS
jgi:hypothetical protein